MGNQLNHLETKSANCKCAKGSLCDHGIRFFLNAVFSPLGKPMILLNGDDDGSTYLLAADSQDPEDWSHTVYPPFVEMGEGSIISKPSVADFGGNGFSEFVMPLSEGVVRLMVRKLSGETRVQPN